VLHTQSASVAQVVLVALPGVDIEAVEEQVQRQCDALPRAEAARSALSHSCIVRVGGREEVRMTPSSVFATRLRANFLVLHVSHPHAMQLHMRLVSRLGCH